MELIIFLLGKTTNAILIFVFIISALILVILPFLTVSLKNRKVLKNYQSLAEKYNLDVNSDAKHGRLKNPVSQGIYREKPISIGTYIKDSGKKKSSCTYIKVTCDNPGNLSFLLEKRSRGNKFILTRDDVSTDDKEFDKSFVLQANNSDKVKKLFDYTNRYKLLQAGALNFYGKLSLNGNEMTYNEPEIISNNESLMRIELILHTMCDIADDIRNKVNSAV